MPFIDAGEVEMGAVLDADVAIVGAGPAGLAVAMCLARAGRRVLLIEAGGCDSTPPDDAVDEIDSVGHPLRPVGSLRHRRFGGSRWYGRCVVLDAIDFERRAWVPGSGWPISASDVAPYYPDAATLLGLPRPAALDPGFWRDTPAHRALDGDGLVPRVHCLSRALDVGRRHRRAIAALPALTVLLHATATALEVAAGAATALRIVGPGGRRITSRARRFVLAGGGLENARLLLLLAAADPSALGPSSTVVGRGYMNHARCEDAARLHLDPSHRDAGSLFVGLTDGWAPRSRSRVQLAAGLDEPTQRRDHLLNAAAFFHPSAPRLHALRESLDGLRSHVATRTLERVDLRRAGRLLAATPLLLRAAAARLGRRPFLVDHLVMVEQLEQTPAPESRVTLSDRRDALGRPLVRVDWRIGADTRRTQVHLHELLAERVRRLGIGRFESRLLADPGWRPTYGDAAHPSGTTRMSVDPRHGVVDAHCRVHALANVYVAGSSVFPTSGHANPTLPLTALALRLAEHLRAAT